MNDSRVNPDSYILVQGWMINELKLKGNELLIFAIIHGFSQDNAGEFTGGLQYLMDWTNSTKKTVIAALKELVSKKLIEKKEIELNGVKYCSYRCKFYNVTFLYGNCNVNKSATTPENFCCQPCAVG